MEHRGHLYLNVNCNMSAFCYSYVIQLNHQELQNFESGGREYLNHLAHDIHYFVPIAKVIHKATTYKLPLNTALIHRNFNPKISSQSICTNRFMSQSVLGISFKPTDYSNAQKVNQGDWRDDRPHHGRLWASISSQHL